MQSIKIGIQNSEVELPTKSRVNNQGNPEFITTDSRSINGKLNTAYIAQKKRWSITWDVISSSDQKIIEDIIDLQFTNGHLNMKISDENGTYTDYTVKVSPMSKGALIQRDVYFTNGFGVEVVEC